MVNLWPLSSHVGYTLGQYEIWYLSMNAVFHENTVQSSNREKVLLVDDQPLNLELMRCYLETDYDVICAESGAIAIDMCNEQQPDIVLMDVRMPNMCGVEACKIIKRDPKLGNVPVVFVTAMNDEVNQRRCWEAGGSDFIPKPVIKTNLQHRVRVQLEARKQDVMNRCHVQYDALTNVHNNSFFEDYCSHQVKLALHNHNELSLAVFNLDNFGHFNDIYGKEHGDLVLIDFATILSAISNKPTSKVFRFEGDTFYCVLPEVNRAGAWRMAHQCMRELARKKHPHLGSATGLLTVSVGLASIQQVGFDHDNVVDLALKNLNLAKDSGRNCIAGWSPTGH